MDLQNFFMKIGDITIHLSSDDPQMKLGVEEEMARFLVEKAEPEITISAAWGDLSKRIRQKKLFDSGALWQIYEEDGKYLFRFMSPALGPLPYKVVSFNHEFTTGEVILHPSYFDRDRPVYPLEYPLDELLITNFLARGRGVEVHALGVMASEGEAYLFVGHSGAGKSTMARLWQGQRGVKILSDDRIILRKEAGKFWICGTPWHGEAGLATPDRALLTAVYFLQHWRENQVVALKGAQALGRLFVSSFVPFYSPSGLDFTLRFLDEVTRSVPCYELRFLPDDSVIEYVKRMRIRN
jgi:hypothetical protein